MQDPVAFSTLRLRMEGKCSDWPLSKLKRRFVSLQIKNLLENSPRGDDASELVNNKGEPKHGERLSTRDNDGQGWEVGEMGNFIRSMPQKGMYKV